MVDTDISRPALRSLLVAAALLVVTVFLPWQQRDVQINAKEPIPVSFSERDELEGFIASTESGKTTIPGYDIHKATPFGDGLLVGAGGSIIVVASLIAFMNRRHSKFTLRAIVGGALLALTVALYDVLISPGHWSPRDWYTGWGGDSSVRAVTEPNFGMFAALFIAAYLAWRSVQMLTRQRTIGSIPPNSSLQSS